MGWRAVAVSSALVFASVVGRPLQAQRMPPAGASLAAHALSRPWSKTETNQPSFTHFELLRTYGDSSCDSGKSDRFFRLVLLGGAAGTAIALITRDRSDERVSRATAGWLVGSAVGGAVFGLDVLRRSLWNSSSECQRGPFRGRLHWSLPMFGGSL